MSITAAEDHDYWAGMLHAEQRPDIDELVALYGPAWMRQGACRSEDQALFFPEGGTATLVGVPCAADDVRAECLAYALEQGPSLHGMWGGTSAAERRKLRRAA